MSKHPCSNSILTEQSSVYGLVFLRTREMLLSKCQHMCLSPEVICVTGVNFKNIILGCTSYTAVTGSVTLSLLPSFSSLSHCHTLLLMFLLLYKWTSFPGILVSRSAPGGTQTMTVTMLLLPSPLSSWPLSQVALRGGRHNHRWDWCHVHIGCDAWEEESHRSTNSEKSWKYSCLSRSWYQGRSSALLFPSWVTSPDVRDRILWLATLSEKQS